MEAYDHRARAREALRGNWITAVAVFFVAGIVAGSGNSSEININVESSQTVQVGMPEQLQQFLETTIGLAAPVILSIGVLLLVVHLAFGGVMDMGKARYTMNLIDRREAEFTDLFSGFYRFFEALAMNVVRSLMIFLGMLLFIIPGVMLTYGYAMAPYIMAEDPDCSGWDALQRSRVMMKGHKWELFWLELTFIGWAILAAFTFGIGNLLLEPYKGVSKASFYRDLQSQNRWNQVENF